MPKDLIHVEAVDLDAAGIRTGLLSAFKAYLTGVLEDRRGAVILAPRGVGHQMLMVLARTVGAALRDENIRLRERGGDLKRSRKKLCYLPGSALVAVLADPAARRALTTEAACFLQDVEHCTVPPAALLALLDARQTSGLPTFVSAARNELTADLERELRARLGVLEADSD